MNSSGLANNSLSSASLGRIETLRTLNGVPTGVTGMSLVDENSLGPGNDSGSHTNHTNHTLHHGQHLLHHILHPHQQHSLGHLGGFSQDTQPSMVPFQESHEKFTDTVAKIETDVTTMSQDMAYFRHVLDFQNLKIEKLTQLLLDLLHNKDVTSIVALLQSMHSNDPFNVEDTHDSVDDSVPDSVHDVSAAIPALQPLDVVSEVGVVNVPGVLLDGNMDPQLHQMAQAAVQALAATKGDSQDDKKSRKRTFSRVNGNSLGDTISKQHQRQQHQQRQMQQLRHQLQKQQLQPQPQQTSLQPQESNTHVLQGQQLHLHSQDLQNSSQVSQTQSLLTHAQLQQESVNKDPVPVVGIPDLDVVDVEQLEGRKKPKVTIDFLHNPMTVKEIYDEFTKGFRGQPPLREMDERFGKYEWRGDSRSKESKRFQRRKKLCDAIERGMSKYGKSVEEIINYIEEFRGEKSLTWVMNGNLPRDLME